MRRRASLRQDVQNVSSLCISLAEIKISAFSAEHLLDNRLLTKIQGRMSERVANMAKPEWGVKRTCPQCATRFYDLMREPLTCPACGATFDPTAVTRPKRGKAAAAAKRAVVADPVEEPREDQLETEEVEASGEDEDDVLDLGDDDVDEDLPEATAEGGDDDSESFTESKMIPDDDTEALADEEEETLDNDDDDVSLTDLEEAESNDDDDDDPDRR